MANELRWVGNSCLPLVRKLSFEVSDERCELKALSINTLESHSDGFSAISS